MKRAKMTFTGDPRGRLERDGFVKIEAGQIQTNAVFDEDFARLRRAASVLPIDHTDEAAGRSRLYGRTLYVPWCGADIPVPPRRYAHSGEFGLEYTQPASVNSDSGGVRRIFSPLPPSIYKNRALLAMIDGFRTLLPFESDVLAESMQTGIHLIKLEATAGHPAKATPNLVHRDGEPFTVAVLLDRVAADGGENVVTAPRWHDHPVEAVPEEDILARFTLAAPLESYVVQDDRVAHYVAPVTCEPTVARGFRTVLLLDYTPLRPAIVLTGMQPPELQAA